MAGERSIRVTLKPISFEQEFPFTPALAERDYPAPIISFRELNRKMKQKVGSLFVEVRPNPLTVIVVNSEGKPVQELTFMEDGNLDQSCRYISGKTDSN